MQRHQHTGPTPTPAEDVSVRPAAEHRLPDDPTSLREGALEAIAEHLSEDPREILRQVRAVGRERLSQARDATREAARQARQAEREMALLAREAERELHRQNREMEREVAQHLRDSRRGERGRDSAEPGTRSRIQQVALELFTENGYEATSLREIAEALGVTKAALYYHFKTKDDIIDSLVHDRIARLSELIRWAESQPRTLATRQEALRRYSTMLAEQGHSGLMRFFERNQSSMTQHKAGVAMRDLMIEMLNVFTEQTAPIQEQIRCSLAIFALHSTWFTVRNPDTTDDERRQAALAVALELVEPRAV